MSKTDVSFDSNVLLYLTSSDNSKASRAEDLIVEGGVISVQVLNEFAVVARRKFAMKWPEIREAIATIRSLCSVRPVTVDIHDLGIRIAERYRYRVYDSMIIAAAVEAGCKTLFTEDLRHGQTIEGLTIRNPFQAG